MQINIAREIRTPKDGEWYINLLNGLIHNWDRFGGVVSPYSGNVYIREELEGRLINAERNLPIGHSVSLRLNTEDEEFGLWFQLKFT